MPWYPCCGEPGEDCPCCSGDQPEAWAVTFAYINMAAITDCHEEEGFDLNTTFLLPLSGGLCTGTYWLGWYCDEDHAPPQYIGWKCWQIVAYCTQNGAGYHLRVAVFVASIEDCPPEPGTTDTFVQVALFEKTWESQPVCADIEDVEMTPDDFINANAWDTATCTISAVMPE